MLGVMKCRSTLPFFGAVALLVTVGLAYPMWSPSCDEADVSAIAVGADICYDRPGTGTVVTSNCHRGSIPCPENTISVTLELGISIDGWIIQVSGGISATFEVPDGCSGVGPPWTDYEWEGCALEEGVQVMGSGGWLKTKVVNCATFTYKQCGQQTGIKRISIPASVIQQIEDKYGKKIDEDRYYYDYPCLRCKGQGAGTHPKCPGDGGNTYYEELDANCGDE